MVDVSGDVDHVELQPRFALALTAAVNFCGEISQIVKIFIALIFRIQTQLTLGFAIIPKFPLKNKLRIK